ncbi:MAG TPA: alpha/beta hydrolase [Marmoricola sp.]|jgi:pimeloyl-ACP methyl ester carboxylesterase|nr:alpha/beta hydrolase [Marmoricola sp.]
MKIERGIAGPVPWAAVGEGRPIVVLSGLSNNTGVTGNLFVRSILGPVLPLAKKRRLVATNRWRNLPADLTMTDLATGHAEALRELFDEPVDLVGISTGGSIAQQVAADHPDVVRRLVLISTGYTLGPLARQEQLAVADLLRAGDERNAAATIVEQIVPWGPIARAAGRLAASWMFKAPHAAADLLATLDAEDGFDLAGCARPIEAPTLLIGGQRDKFYPAETLERTTDLIPGSTLLQVPRRGHMTVMQSKRATAHVAGFLMSGG